MPRKLLDLDLLPRTGSHGTNLEWGDPLSLFTAVGFPEILDDTSQRTGVPLLSIYYTGDTSVISITGSNIHLTHDSVTVHVPLSGKTTSQVASFINRLGMPYTATVLYETEDVLAISPFISSILDKTIDDGSIIRGRGHVVKALEEAQIRILPPYNSSRFEPWNIVINRGWVTRRYKGGDWIFAVPEYENQTWSIKYGRGFIDLKDVIGERLGPRALGVPRAPIHWDRGNLQLRVRDTIQPANSIQDVDIHNGIVYLNRDYDDNQTILIDYTYKEDGYVYPVADINPTEFHNPGVLDRYVLFYLLPHIGPNGAIRDSCVRYSESSTLAGAIYSIPNTSEPIMLLGATQVRQVHDYTEVQITDTRTRGGGVKWDKFRQAVTRNREILNTADRGFYDGRPYPGNMALFVTLPEEVKDALSKAEIDGVIKRFMAYGTYCFIEYD
jgi:hypothetical protein